MLSVDNLYEKFAVSTFSHEICLNFCPTNGLIQKMFLNLNCKKKEWQL